MAISIFFRTFATEHKKKKLNEFVRFVKDYLELKHTPKIIIQNGRYNLKTTANYDYTAPKQNERITIRYNLNKLIPDTTLLVENVRPISADVLVKEAKPIYIDVELNIVVKPEYVNNSNIVVQNVKDAVTSSLNISKFGQIIDSSDVIVTAQSVEGVDRVRIIQFNKADESGSVLSISAENNEYLQSNNVIINLETR